MASAIPHKKSNLNDLQAMEHLREILLHEERATLSRLQELLDNEEQLAEKIDPIIQRHIHFLEENFPNSYHKVINRIIDERLKQSQDELINIIYPRLGILIRKYIRNEFKLLRERIDGQIQRSPFSFLSSKKRKSSEEVLIDLEKTSIEEAYVISHESGLLLGSASSASIIDKDMIAGMLTAIKGFVGDAFNRTDEELRGIQYGNYELLVQNFYNYYIALAISGTISEADRDQLTAKILTFASKELDRDLQEPDSVFYAHLQKQLTAYFIKPSKTRPNGK